MKLRLISNIVHYLLLLFIIVYIISGLSITYYRIAEQLTLGWLSKPLAFKIHDYLLIPFLMLLALHLYLVIRRRKK